MSWNPTSITLVHERLGTRCSPFVVATDDGNAYLKAVPKQDSPHCLVCEVIGARAANFLGLPTAPFVTRRLTVSEAAYFPEEDCPTESLFWSKGMVGHAWGGEAAELDQVANPSGMLGLVVLDSLIRNRDRYSKRGNETRINLGNVFLEDLAKSRARPGRYVQMCAIDHSHCLCNGDDLPGRLAREATEAELFGLFPQFIPYVTSDLIQPYLDKLKTLSSNPGVASGFVASIPSDWNFSSDASSAVTSFLRNRAQYLVSNLRNLLVDAGAITAELFPGSP